MKYSNKQKNIHHQNANFTKDLFKNHFYTHTYTRTGKGNFPHNAFIITKKIKIICPATEKFATNFCTQNCMTFYQWKKKLI